MFNKTSKWFLVATLLATSSGLFGSRIPPEKKRTAERELSKFMAHIAKHHPKLKADTLSGASWQVWLDRQIDPQQVALAAYVYALIHAYQNCIDYLNQGNRTDVGFMQQQEQFNMIKVGLLRQTDVPVSLNERIANMETGLWTKVSELGLRAYRPR